MGARTPASPKCSIFRSSRKKFCKISPVYRARLWITRAQPVGSEYRVFGSGACVLWAGPFPGDARTETTPPRSQGDAHGRRYGGSAEANVVATFSGRMNTTTLNKTTFNVFKVKADGTLTQIKISNVTVTSSTDGTKAGAATLRPFSCPIHPSALHRCSPRLATPKQRLSNSKNSSLGGYAGAPVSSILQEL